MLPSQMNRNYLRLQIATDKFIFYQYRILNAYRNPADPSAPTDQGHTMKNAEIETRRKAAMSRGVGVMTQIFVDRAENAEIWDKEGNRYIDFAAGIAVVNTGHRHPKVIAAVKDQLDHFTHTCHQVVPYKLRASCRSV